MRILHAMLTACVLTALAGPACGEAAVEWWGRAENCPHHDLKVRALPDGSAVLVFDLSAMGHGAKVYHASLRAPTPRSSYKGLQPGHTLHAASGLESGVRSPEEPIEVYAVSPDATAPAGEPLKLEAPRFTSFDATAAVAAGKDTAAFLLKPTASFKPAAMILEVTYDGKAGQPPPPVTGLKAFHRAGQTFITWTEIDKIITADPVRWGEYEKLAAAGSPRGTVLYRIYRSDRPITAETIGQAELVDEVAPLSGYDGRIHQNRTRGEIFQGRDPEVIVPRYCIAATPAPSAFKPNSEFVNGKNRRPEWLAKTIPLYTGLYVHNPRRAGRSYYAVVPLVNGVANTRDLSAGNSLAKPVTETVGPGEPILYRRLDLSRPQGRGTRVLQTQFFTFWANPPLSNVPQGVVHFLVGVEGADPSPPRSMHVKVGIRDMYWSELVGGNHPNEWKRRPHLNVALVADRSVAAIGYHSSYGTLKAYSQGAVEPYTVRLLERILPYVQKRWTVNPGRVSCNGAFLGLHLPGIFTYTVAGGHQSVLNLKWSPQGRALAKRWGPAGQARTADGSDAYDLVDASAIVRADPAAETPFLYCPGGKGRGHQVEIGWTQNPKAYRALEDTRRPFVAVWGLHLREGGRFGNMAAWDRNVPAFSRCSLDDNPGSGHMLDGDFTGQINGYLWWDAATGVDEPDRWALTAYLVDECARDGCTVDVTPRRLKRFKPAPNETFDWTNRSLSDDKVIASGTVTADRYGLVTLKQVAVTKGRNRLEITRRRR